MFEELLKDQILKDPALKGMLAAYNCRPAFFYQKAPRETDCAWSGMGYPRVIYNVDMREDPGRKVSGVLVFDIDCVEDQPVMSEDIERRILELVSGTFYSDAGGSTICAIWNRSDMFEYEKRLGGDMRDKQVPRVFGTTMIFDITAFPVQLTTDPDPVQALNEWTKKTFDQALVIAYDELQDIWTPTDKHPAVYWRISALNANSAQSFATTCYECQIIGHVITRTVSERAAWLKAIVEELTIAGEVLFLDRSPFFIRQVTVNFGANQLYEGQLVVTGQYRVLSIPRQIPVQQRLMEANLKYEWSANYGN